MWGLLTIYWKQLSGFNAVELIGWRIVSASLVMAVVVSVRGRWPAIGAAFADRALAIRIAIAAVLLTGNWTSYVYAVVHDHVIETALGYFMAPLGTMVLGITVLGERLSTAQKVAIGLAGAAVVELTLSYGRPPIAALIMAVTWSFYGLLKRRVPLPAVESFAAESFVLVVPAAIVVAALGGIGGQHPAQRRPPATSRLVALAGVTTAVPADPVRLRRDPRAVHRARAAAVPRPDDQLPARVGAVRRGAAVVPTRSGSAWSGRRC